MVKIRWKSYNLQLFNFIRQDSYGTVKELKLAPFQVIRHGYESVEESRIVTINFLQLIDHLRLSIVNGRDGVL